MAQFTKVQNTADEQITENKYTAEQYSRFEYQIIFMQL